MDRGANPPHGIGGQAKALVGLEAFDRLHQPDIALGHDLADWQAVAAIAHGDLGHEAQMRGDKLVSRVAVIMLAREKSLTGTYVRGRKLETSTSR